MRFVCCTNAILIRLKRETRGHGDTQPASSPLPSSPPSHQQKNHCFTMKVQSSQSPSILTSYRSKLQRSQKCQHLQTAVHGPFCFSLEPAGGEHRLGLASAALTTSALLPGLADSTFPSHPCPFPLSLSHHLAKPLHNSVSSFPINGDRVRLLHPTLR